MSDLESFDPLQDMLDERPDALAVFGFRVVSFVDAEGQPHVDWTLHGSQVQALTMVGTLMAAAFEVFHDQMHAMDDE